MILIKREQQEKKNDLNEIKIAGVEGAFKYKNNKNFPLYDQYEMHDICKNLGKADIVISHNSPLSIHDSRDDIKYR